MRTAFVILAAAAIAVLVSITIAGGWANLGLAFGGLRVLCSTKAPFDSKEQVIPTKQLIADLLCASASDDNNIFSYDAVTNTLIVGCRSENYSPFDRDRPAAAAWTKATLRRAGETKVNRLLSFFQKHLGITPSVEARGY
jgi:hypothetical protein